MTIKHHPSDPTLAAFATGTLDEARSVVVATHIATCPACRALTKSYEHVGGVALEQAEPMPLADDALQRALSTIAATGPSRRQATNPPASEWRAPLARYALGEWRWIGPGIHWRSVRVPPSNDTRVFMLKAVPGTRLPHHAHTGIEWTCVLQGTFRHQHGTYAAGDFDEADESVEHDPVVEGDVECVCLIALQGRIEFKSLIGRLVQPFVRM